MRPPWRFASPRPGPMEEEPPGGKSAGVSAGAPLLSDPQGKVAGSWSQPPETAVEPIHEELHGTIVVDPYRWLEGSAAPEILKPDADLDSRVEVWTQQQNAYTRSVLDALPGREELESRLRGLMQMGRVSPPVARRNRYFYFKREGSLAQSVLYLRQGAWGKPQVLLDPNQLDTSGLTALSWFEPNHDGTLVAFGLSQSGDEKDTLYLLDVDGGKWLAEEIPGRVGDVNWLPDATGFLYSQLADVEDPYSRRIRYHRVGTHQRHDPVLFEQYKEGPLATTWGPFGYCSHDGRWLILGYWTGTDSNDLWVVDFDGWLRTGELVRTEIVCGEKALSAGPVVGDTLYLRTSLEAPNQRLVAVDLHDPVRHRWRLLIPERRDATLRQVSAARGILVAQYLKDASSHLELFDLEGAPRGEVELPGTGSAYVVTAYDRSEAFLAFESFNHPPSVYQVDLRTGAKELWDQSDVPVDPALAELKQVRYTSRDGTRVTMFVVHKKGLELNGNHPTLLMGYGGFNLGQTPVFGATLFPWLEAGGVFALPNLRGGGEYGEAWHRGGMLEKKQNVFDDFIAAAEWLIGNGYTQPRRLGISGGSNGGLLTGAVMHQRPELFGAVISAVPLLDMVRYHHFLMARFWVPELGSSSDPEQFAYLLEYSPYHNVKTGVRYPAVFFTAAENDTRVHPLHAKKMAALMQAAAAGQTNSEPVLLWVNLDAGHGPGKPLAAQIRDVADLRIFMMWRLGMIEEERASTQDPQTG